MKDKQKDGSRGGVRTTRTVLVVCLALSLAIVAYKLTCIGDPQAGVTFDPKVCMSEIPEHVDGLRIVAGPRTARSVIRDMVPVVCNAKVLFRQMRSQVKPGRVARAAEPDVRFSGDHSEKG